MNRNTIGTISGSKNDPSSPSKFQSLKRSCLYQYKEFFSNSNLHGVRYIAEKNRPFYEKFIWICCVLICIAVSLMIIFSLWEKFQSNSTITGIDTDFNGWDILFPAITVCPRDAVDPVRVKKFIRSHWEQSTLEDETSVKYRYYEEFLTNVANLSYSNVQQIEKYEDDLDLVEVNLKDVATNTTVECENLLYDCSWSSTVYNCCKIFRPVMTDIGSCFTFNSKYLEQGNEEESDIEENNYGTTDLNNIAQLSLELNAERVESNPLSIFIHSSVDKVGSDMRPHHVWTRRVVKILFSSEETYTTENARQLSIKQRRCVFPDEIRLITDDVYTYGACMAQCRMNTAKWKCGCVPFFYLPDKTDDYKSCNVRELACIAYYKDEIENDHNCDCELSCMNTVYKVEKLEDYEGVNPTENSLIIGFVSPPLIRYKRDVLFGWVDLFVAFGGIAGLFLGFSALTVVETLYFFTLRAFCMAYREKDELREFQRRSDDRKQQELTDLTSFSGKRKQHVNNEEDLPIYRHYLP